jgi:Asp-tRNA(Asn)/Glu-tRNA(Gln) amidotransferase A subunit family amidase
MGAPFSEEMLFSIGRAYQNVTAWHEEKPPLYAK